MNESKKFHGIVNYNNKGELVCFCSYEEYLQGKCACREDANCPEAMIEITILPNSKPSDKTVVDLKKATRSIKNTNKSLNSIKAGVSRLERALKGSKFKL